jgi:hypothetical protein
MTWASLIAVLLELFGPMLRDLLERLFKAVEPKLGSPADGVFTSTARLFDAAKSELWWWQFGKRSVLSVCRQIALNRSHHVSQAIFKGVAVPALTLEEAKEISRVAL